MHVQFLVVGGCVHAHPCRCVCVLVSAEGRGVRFPMYCASYTTMVRLRAGALARLVRVRAHGVAFRYWFAETHTLPHTHAALDIGSCDRGNCHLCDTGA